MTDPAVITVRSNLHLWLLTGRANDFHNETLNTGVVYSVSATPDEVVEARRLLKLDETASDFHVLAVLAASRISTSLIRTLPHEHDAVFVNRFLRLPSNGATYPMLPADDRSWPRIDGSRAGRDGFTRLTVRSLGGGVAEITTDNGGSDKTSYSVTPYEEGGYRLSIGKAVEYGIHAHFAVPSWAEGSEVTVRFSPTRYPFGAVAKVIRDNSVARRLMTSEGVAQAFAETENSATKVGLLGLAIIRRMLRFVNSGQSGFEVAVAFTSVSGEAPRRTYSLDPVFSASLAAPDCNPAQPVGFDV